MLDIDALLFAEAAIGHFISKERTKDTKKIFVPPRRKEEFSSKKEKILFSELRVLFLRETFFLCSLRALRLNHSDP